jgi:hypothetical protein
VKTGSKFSFGESGSDSQEVIRMFQQTTDTIIIILMNMGEKKNL